MGILDDMLAALSREANLEWLMIDSTIMPLAVDDIARGVCRLSMTIRSFSSSDQRRRRPVSTTSSRST